MLCSMGLVDALAAYTLVTAAALGAMRRGRIVTVHPENIKNNNAKMVRTPRLVTNRGRRAGLPCCSRG